MVPELLVFTPPLSFQEEKLTVPDDIGDVVDDLIVDDEIIEISKHPE